MANYKKIEFRGNTFEYNPKAFEKWSVVQGIRCANSDPARFYAAVDKILAGHMDDAAEALDDDLMAVMELLDAISEQITGTAKN